MQLQIITIFCLCEDFLTETGQKDDPQTRFSTAEVMTAALVSAWFFGGNQRLTCLFLKEHGYMPKMISESRFNRRLLRISEEPWMALFQLLARIHKELNAGNEYIVDSCPVPVCNNLRIKRSRIYRLKKHRLNEYRGYCASKRTYFYGIKLHLVVTSSGKPVDFLFTPGSTGDMPGLRSLLLDLLEGSELYADKGYTDYQFEDSLAELAQIELIAARKNNSNRQHPGHIAYLCQVIRKRVESTFSDLNTHFARHIHAVTARGFELKVFLTLLALSILG